MSVSPSRRQRSSSRSPKTSRHTSPNRRPLHERSHSELNELTRQSSEDDGAQKMYAKTAFPRLPSQFFPPSGQTYIYEDETASPSGGPSLPARSPLRRHRSSSSAGSSGKENVIVDQPTRKKSRSSTFQSGLSSTSVASLGVEGYRQPHQVEAESFLDDPSDDSNKNGQSSAEALPTRTFIPYRETPSAESFPQNPRRPSTSEEILPLSVGREDPAQTTGFRPIPRLKSAKRLRSSSSASANSRNLSAEAFSSSVMSDDGRPRSSSHPSAPTEALLQALIDSGTNVQYPKLKKPSAASLRTNTSSTRAAYPPPLRLQRKRANSRLRHSAQVDAGPSDQSLQRPRLHPAASSSSVLTGSSSISIPYQIPSEEHVDASATRWDDEADDTIAELHPQHLRPQASNFNLPRDSSTDLSRPSTNASSSSRPGSFYRFLNDSYTAWAQFYYRGDGKLRLDTPPQVTDVQHQPPSTPVSRLNGSTNASGPSQSPDSAGFPDTIYVPRARPRQQDDTASFGQSEDEITALPPVTASTQRTQHTHAESFNRTPELPHLSPDKRSGMRFREWQAPSFDSETNAFSRTNRQIVMFCVGFIFPLTWLLASVLPIPPRPQMRHLDSEEVYTEKERTVVDLFNDVDKKRYVKARWWRNLNRWMSLTGICVIAAVIACAIVATR